jgi:hypothetical protein
MSVTLGSKKGESIALPPTVKMTKQTTKILSQLWAEKRLREWTGHHWKTLSVDGILFFGQYDRRTEPKRLCPTKMRGFIPIYVQSVLKPKSKKFN